MTSGAAAGEITIHADSARPLDRRLFGTNVPAWLAPDTLADPAFQAATYGARHHAAAIPGWELEQRLRLAGLRASDEEPECFVTWAARPSDFVGFMRATGIPGVWTTSFSGTAEEAAAAVAFFNGDVDDDRALGVDRKGATGRPSANGRGCVSRVAIRSRPRSTCGRSATRSTARYRRPGPNCAEFGWEDVWTCDGTQYVEGDEADDGYLEFRDRMRDGRSRHRGRRGRAPRRRELEFWGNKVIAGTGDLLDFYVIHHYGFGGEPDGGAALAVPQQSWPELMQVATATLAAGNPSRTVPIAITEYNMVAFQDGDNDRLMARAINLLYIADTIGQMAENGVTIANQWNLANGKAAQRHGLRHDRCRHGSAQPAVLHARAVDTVRRRVARRGRRVRPTPS